MSYFFAGCGTDHSKIRDIDHAFADVVPSEIKNNVLHINKGSSFLASFGSSKVISDFCVSDEITGSWLTILGTPLVKLPTEEQRVGFIRRFFHDPKRVIIDELDGCFALISYDAAKKTFYAVTDGNNTIPIYYAATANGIFLSSHELPLARFLCSEIDPLGFAMTIQLKLTWGSYTRFKNIKKLLPCQILTYRHDEMSPPENYWRPSEEVQWPSTFEDVIDQWLSILKGSLKAYYDQSQNKTVICDFTGGEDSRLLLSGCHALGIPFIAMVDGLETDPDVLVAREASRKTGFELIVRPKLSITEEQLLSNAMGISLMNDAYQDYFESCAAFATDAANPPRNYEYVKFCGAPGGEAFRGSYYLRAKIFFPSKKGDFDHRFFTRMKFMLDFCPGLLHFSDEECRNLIFQMAENALKDVAGFSVGSRVDHLIRVFQTCHTGLIYKNPRYLPFATRQMTRSVYNLPPQFKRGGKLTKACTEILYPEVAFVKTRKGVPTIRKTPLRTFLFFPEYLSTVKSILRGATSRLLKWTESNKPAYEWNKNAPAIMTLLTKAPYGNWFSSSKSMITGHLYHREAVDALLADARSGSSKYVPILGRIINQELACRWVYREK